VGFHSLTTTTHPPNVNLPSSGQQVTARLSAPKVSVAGGNRDQDPPYQGHYIRIGVSVCGVWRRRPSPSIVINRLINHHPPSSFVAGHLNDTSFQHLPGLLGVCLTKTNRGADPVRSRRRLYRACRRWKEQRAAPNVQPAGLGCAPAAAVLYIRSVRYKCAMGSSDKIAWGVKDLCSMVRVASSRAADG
jgi:hypothetical protein